MSVSPLSSFDTLKYPLFSSVQLLSCVRLFATPWTAACKASLSITNSRSLLKRVHRVYDAIQPSHPLSSPSPPAFNLSQHQGLFKWVRWPKYWSFSFNISPSSEHPGLISFRMDWLDLLAIQHHNSKASVIWHSAFFIVHQTTGKNIALARWTFVGKVMFLLFNSCLGWS